MVLLHLQWHFVISFTLISTFVSWMSLYWASFSGSFRTENRCILPERWRVSQLLKSCFILHNVTCSFQSFVRNICSTLAKNFFNRHLLIRKFLSKSLSLLFMIQADKVLLKVITKLLGEFLRMGSLIYQVSQMLAA